MSASPKGTSHLLHVIGAGWGRTGTHSLKTALDLMNIKCYSMNEVIAHGDVAFWNEMCNGKPVHIDRIASKRGYDAVCDFPCSAFFLDFVECFPDAKVILTIRNEEDWYRSMMDTLMLLNPDCDDCPTGVKLALGMGYPASGYADLMHNLLTKHCFRGDLSKENMIRQYRKHNDNVRRLVPPERLLVLNVFEGHGWTSLCRFLNTAFPSHVTASTPFPHVNTTAEYQSNYITYGNAIGWSAGVVGVGLPFYFMPDKKPVLLHKASSHQLLPIGSLHGEESKAAADTSSTNASGGVLSYFNPACW